jgi:hypothetical protein
MGCVSSRCECISWAKKKLSSSEERPNSALEGHLSHTRIFEVVATPQPRVQPKSGNRHFFLFSATPEPGVLSL